MAGLSCEPQQTRQSAPKAEPTTVRLGDRNDVYWVASQDIAQSLEHLGECDNISCRAKADAGCAGILLADRGRDAWDHKYATTSGGGSSFLEALLWIARTAARGETFRQLYPAREAFHRAPAALSCMVSSLSPGVSSENRPQLSRIACDHDVGGLVSVQDPRASDGVQSPGSGFRIR